MHPKLEDTLGFGGFGYPALAAVNSRKKKLAIFKGSFSQEGLDEFLRYVYYLLYSEIDIKNYRANFCS